MSRGQQPWWASADGVEDLDEVDPVEAFRAARRPAGTDGPATDEPAADGPATRPGGTDGPATDEPAADGPATRPGGADEPSGDGVAGAHRPELCGICPLCSLARSIEDTRPELLEHLTEAARHLAAAARSLVEYPPPSRSGGAPEGRSPQGGRPPRHADAGVERIVLDDARAAAAPRPPGHTTGEGDSS